MFLSKGAQVVMMNRNADKSAAAITALKQELGSHAEVTFVHMNLAELASVREAAEQVIAEVPPPIKEEQVEAILNDLRNLWREDVAAVAPSLRELTGPVTVCVKREEWKPRANWLAESTINLGSVTAQLSTKHDCPTARTWDYLETRSWTNQECEGVWLDPQHNR